MAGVLTALAMTVCCFGLGAAMLRLLKIGSGLSALAALLWSFVLGFGFQGWLVFFLGVGKAMNTVAFTGLLGAGAVLAVIFRPSWRAVWADTRMAPVDGRSAIFYRMILFGLAAAFAFDLVEGFAPPADADTLAYHFATPKLFIGWGGITFIPRAVDGAIPMLVQMTYAASMALGGELGVTLWVMILGWAAVALVFSVAKDHLDRDWALGAALLYATTFAVVYSSGTGQVEARNVLFVLVGAAALSRAIETRDWRFVVVTALATGFFAATKYTGLLFAASAGAALMIWWRALTPWCVFGLCTLLAGGQWYAWNWINSGDPIFPLLFGSLDYGAAGYWDQAHQEAFQTGFYGAEKAVGVNLWEFLLYPFKATFASPAEFEARRTGFGPAAMLVLPWAVVGAWTARRKILSSPIAVYGCVAFLFYVLWFFTGSSQRVRHLLPIYPLLLICLLDCARLAGARFGLMAPLVTAAALTCCLQLGGHALFSFKFFEYFLGGHSRAWFMDRNVALSEPVSWINRNLDRGNRIFLDTRYLAYLMDVPYFHGHKIDQAVINILPRADNPGIFLRQLRRQGIDHILVSNWPQDPGEISNRGYLFLVAALLDANCATIAHKFESDRFASRTVRSYHSIKQTGLVLRLTDHGCGLKQ